jgi:hypothetical protein
MFPGGNFLSSRVFLRRVALAAIPLLAGCYTYVPAELATVPPGGEVRVYLTRTAVATLPEDVAPTDLARLYVNGRLTAQERDSITLGIRVGAGTSVMPTSDLRQLVKVRTAEIVDLQRRQFSTPRTGLLVGAGVGVAAAVITLIFQAQSDVHIGDPNDDTSRVPILTFPMRLPAVGW